MSLPRVLAVDDDPLNLMVLNELLQDFVCEVVLCPGGAEAMQCLDDPSADFDLLLLDIMMPQVSGFEVLRFVRNHACWCDLPVILQSALNSPAEIRQGLNAGANAYLTKPLDLDEFSQTLSPFLQRKEVIY